MTLISIKGLNSWSILGVCHVLVGTFFLLAKPYKKNWMSYVDGLIIDTVGIMLLVRAYHNECVFLAGVIASAVVFVVLFLVGFYLYVCKRFTRPFSCQIV